MPIKPKRPNQTNPKPNQTNPVLPFGPVPVPVPVPFGPMDPPPAIPDRTLELEAERLAYIAPAVNVLHSDLVWENLPVHRPAYRMTPDEAERWWAPGVRADQIRWGFR